MEPLPPIDVVDLFPGLRSALLDLLADLSEAEWNRPTVCAGWSVKDIALHLLADDCGILSRQRDGVTRASVEGDAPVLAWPDFVAMIDRLNAVWVEATRRISPRLLRELLGFTGPAVDAYFRGLDPSAIGGPVDWAGPQPAPVWLDVAREYTERWVHQQQIRDAVDRPGLTERRWLHPVLDAFVRALPHTLRDVPAVTGLGVRLVIAGDAGGAWEATRSTTGWSLGRVGSGVVTATVTMDQDLAWRVFTRGVAPADAVARVGLDGDRAPGYRVLEMVSIIT